MGKMLSQYQTVKKTVKYIALYTWPIHTKSQIETIFLQYFNVYDFLNGLSKRFVVCPGSLKMCHTLILKSHD